MEHNEVSVHEVRVYKALTNGWQTAKEIGDATKGVASRTVRAHLHRLVALGIADQAEVFPGHRYRRSVKAVQRNRSYVQRLELAAEVFGIIDTSAS